MIFPSYEFLLIFLPLFLLFWYTAKTVQLRLIILTLASYTFYAWFDYRFLRLLIIFISKNSHEIINNNNSHLFIIIVFDMFFSFRTRRKVTFSILHLLKSKKLVNSNNKAIITTSITSEV